jgi:hypothetical protein
MVKRSITVDHETRVTAQHQRGIKMSREATRYVGRTPIPADVLGQHTLIKAKAAEPFGDPIGRVITDQNRAASPVRIDRLDRGRIIEAE